ncbi:MAG: alpha/beta hydrolase [Alphaproteobacteria bacterium]|nr:alpha/beta hydrolase [Alphaproteobacteria bacterium]
MFEYFGENYSWDLAVLMAMQLGGHPSEIDEACRPLRALAAAPDAKTNTSIQLAWLEAWLTLARKLETKADQDLAEGHRLSAAGKYRRACVYYQQADRMAPHDDPRKVQAYDAMRDTFSKAIEYAGIPMEWIEIPYEGTSLPALFLPGEGDGQHPCMTGFDGFDVTKEWTYLSGLADAFRVRGVSTLLVDHPGVGLALRDRGLSAVVETERPASACIDYLSGREDTNEEIGIVAMSLGGYYAPRAAAFEKRLKACVAWGARWDNTESHGRILRDPNAARSIPGWIDHALKVYGQPDIESCAAMIAKMTLAGVAEHILCPLLVVHGENDRQVPFDQAQKTIDGAIHAKRRDLRVFTKEEGGCEHVNGDNFSLAIDVIADWSSDVLLGRP